MRWSVSVCNCPLTVFGPLPFLCKVPRFKAAFKTQLNEPLVKLGMVAPFSDKAEFPKISSKAGYKIDAVIHEAVIEG